MKRNWRQWFGWETLLSFSMYGSTLRILPIPQNIMWGITLTAFVMALLWMLMTQWGKGIRIQRHAAVFLGSFYILVLLSITSLFWSPISLATLVNSDAFIILNVLIPTIALLIRGGTTPGLEKRWLMGVAFATGMIFFYIILIWLAAGKSLYSIFMTQTTDRAYSGNEYLAVGQALMCFSIICFIWSAYATSWRKTTFILGTTALWLAMESGGRGPVVWGIVALLMMIIYDLLCHRGSLKRWARIILLVGSLLIVVFSLIATFYPIDTLIQRMEFLNRFIIDQDRGYDELSSIGARIMYMNYAVALITDNPLIGYGALSFRALTGVLYPHNIFLDAWVELGIIGLLLVTFLLIQG